MTLGIGLTKTAKNLFQCLFSLGVIVSAIKMAYLDSWPSCNFKTIFLANILFMALFILAREKKQKTSGFIIALVLQIVSGGLAWLLTDYKDQLIMYLTLIWLLILLVAFFIFFLEPRFKFSKKIKS